MSGANVIQRNHFVKEIRIKRRNEKMRFFLTLCSRKLINQKRTTSKKTWTPSIKFDFTYIDFGKKLSITSLACALSQKVCTFRN